MNLLGTLAFLITLLFLVISLGVVPVSLLRKRTGRVGRIGAAMLAWLAVYVVILFAVSLTSRESVLGQGQEHCFDEMCFSVQGVTQTKTLENRQANGLFYVVDVRLRNAARRTAQKPSNPQLGVIDDERHEYKEMLEGQGEMAGQAVTAGQLWNRRLSPGEIMEQRVAFDLPPNTLSPRLVIAEGPGFPTDVIIGDENSFLHAKTTFRLK